MFKILTKREREIMKKEIITGVALALLATGAQAGIAGVITKIIEGECNKADKKGIQMCTQKKDGKGYFVFKKKRYEDRKDALKAVKKEAKK